MRYWTSVTMVGCNLAEFELTHWSEAAVVSMERASPDRFPVLLFAEAQFALTPHRAHLGHVAPQP